MTNRTKSLFSTHRVLDGYIGILGFTIFDNTVIPAQKISAELLEWKNAPKDS